MVGYFIDDQGFQVKEAVMYQENQSTILLDNNDRLSSGNWTKNIRVRYFLIKDRIAMGDMKVKYYPMGNMLASHLTKSLQVYNFHRFRAEIQGNLDYTPSIDLVWNITEENFKTIPRECVDRSDAKADISTSE